jgi:hypothetical protein
VTDFKKYFALNRKTLRASSFFLPFPGCYAPADFQPGKKQGEETNMTPRAIRRAAQRHADKLARKADKLAAAAAGQPFVETELPAEEPETPAIPSAESANAHLSAIPSALTGQVTLLPTADAAPYGQLLRDYQAEFQPVGLQELNLVQTLAETDWRVRRTLALEMALFAKGRIEFAAQFAEHKPELRESLIDVHTFLTYEKQIHSLQLQEARLSRRAEKARAELRALQQERTAKERGTGFSLSKASTARPPEIGFEFSNHEIEPDRSVASFPNRLRSA